MAKAIVSFVIACIMFFVSGAISYHTFKNKGRIEFPFSIGNEKSAIILNDERLGYKALQLKSFINGYLIIAFIIIGVVAIINLETSFLLALLNLGIIGVLEEVVKKMMKRLQ